MNENHTRTIAGVPIRPFSCGTLNCLIRIGSPLLAEGTPIGGEDIIAFAWIHAAPIAEIEQRIASGTWRQAAQEWAHTVPCAVYRIAGEEFITSALNTLSRLWIDEKSGFVPFPQPSSSAHSLKGRASVIGWIRSIFGSRRHNTPA